YFATGNKSTLRSDRLLRLLFQIVISILRLRNNHKLLDSRDLKLKGQSGCWIKASKFASELEMRFQISLPPSEIFYLEKNLEALIAHEQRTVATLNFSEERIEEMVSMFSKYIHPHLQ
ncbi:MAG TPA: hypothetical protein DDZ66_02015, partial [Firmicutes bacterium]|nr:hypothetical protein [Bacillota bacterium]